MKLSKLIEVIGAALVIVGSFLPWESSGGFANYAINGLQVDFASFRYWLAGIHEFPVYDYGGGLVISLTLAFLTLTLRPPRFINSPTFWNLITSTVLLTLSIFFVGRWLFHLYERGSLVEQPTLLAGLIIVVFGSTLLFLRSLIIHRQITLPYKKMWANKTNG